MNDDNLRAALDNDHLRPFWPLVYIAWADGDLTASEIDSVRAAACCSALDDDDEKALAAWLTPKSPPSAKSLAALLRTVQARLSASDSTSDSTTRATDFVTLAEALASRPLEESQAQALRTTALALGVVEREAVASFFPPALRNRGALATKSEPSGFTSEEITIHLDGEWRASREKVRGVIGRPPFVAFSPADSLDAGSLDAGSLDAGAAYREQTLTWCRELADRGMGGRAVLESGDDVRMQGKFITTFDTLAAFDLSLVVKFGVQFGLFGGSIFFLGTKRHHEKYLSDVCDVSLAGCFAMTERGHGSNVQQLETTATYDLDSDTIEIHTPNDSAHKEYIGNAACHGKLATVFAQLVVDGEHHGVHAVLVPIRNADGSTCEGVRIEDCGDKMGLAGVDNGRLWFDHVRVPRESLLDRYGRIDDDGVYASDIASKNRRFFTMLGTLVGGRVSVAGAAITAAKVGLTTSIRYAAARRQFGPAGESEVTLLSYPSHQRKLLPRLAEMYSLHAAHAFLLERFLARSEEDAREVESLAAGIKALATRACTDTLQICREACGGQGYLAINRFSDLKADTDVFATFEGDNTVLLLLVAKSVLTAYQRQFAGGSVFTILHAVRERAQMTLAELNPMFGRNTDVDHLRSTAFHLEAFRHREQRLIQSAAARMKRRLDDGVDSFSAFLQVQPHLLDLARAHMERVVVEQRILATRSIENEELRQVLEDVGALYALFKLDDDMAWFLENGLFEAAKARAVRREVTALSEKLAPHAVTLADGFGIPSSVLGPIAFADQTAR